MNMNNAASHSFVPTSNVKVGLLLKVLFITKNIQSVHLFGALGVQLLRMIRFPANDIYINHLKQVG